MRAEWQDATNYFASVAAAGAWIVAAAAAVFVVSMVWKRSEFMQVLRICLLVGILDSTDAMSRFHLSPLFRRQSAPVPRVGSPAFRASRSVGRRVGRSAS